MGTINHKSLKPFQVNITYFYKKVSFSIECGRGIVNIPSAQEIECGRGIVNIPSAQEIECGRGIVNIPSAQEIECKFPLSLEYIYDMKIHVVRKQIMK